MVTEWGNLNEEEVLGFRLAGTNFRTEKRRHPERSTYLKRTK